MSQDIKYIFSRECVSSPYQVEFQVAKLSPMLACFIQQCKGTTGPEKRDEVRITDQ